jgi:hypothetical protein
MKKLIYFAIFMAIFASCSPPEVGYISDNVHALYDTIFVPRGIFYLSAAAANEGSTYPLKFEITGYTDKNGNPTTALTDKKEIQVWKKSYNPITDITSELVRAKLATEPTPSIMLNSFSGELAFTQATKQVTDNDIFIVNAKVSNVRGERNLPQYVVVKLKPFVPVEFPVEMRSWVQLYNKTLATPTWEVPQAVNVAKSAVLNDNDVTVPSVLDGTHPYITILKTSSEPINEVKAKMIICDSYGTPISPAKIINYPSGTTYLANFHESSVETVVDATSTTFNFPAPPFPGYSRSYTSGVNVYLMYYLSTEDAFTFDKAKYEADLGVKSWTKYYIGATTEIAVRAYIRWGIKINDTGTWELKMKIPYTIKK